MAFSLIRRLVDSLGMRRLSLGARGERFAAAYLKKQGFRMIARNRMHRHGEIDLIGIDGDSLVFIEVRTRRSEEFMTPEQSIRHHKRRTIINTVRRLVRKHKKAGLQPRIDVVAIIWPEGAKKPTVVRHHRAAIPVGAF